MNYIVAVSGGVDSVALLDMLVKNKHEANLIVAHFDHGIRPDSRDDARFVESLAAGYSLPVVVKREELGASASEAYARERRYAFLNELARQEGAKLVTAHHLDDAVETIAINLTRGTGWRGLAVLDADVRRPLLDVTKAELYDYARTHNLAWREDPTNQTDAYLRNRLRRKTSTLSHDAKRQLRALHAQQRFLKREITQEVERLVGQGPYYSRHFFTQLAPSVALECLRVITNGQLTRPQLARLLHAIKVARPQTQYEAGETVTVKFSTRQFSF